MPAVGFFAAWKLGMESLEDVAFLYIIWQTTCQAFWIEQLREGKDA